MHTHLTLKELKKIEKPCDVWLEYRLQKEIKQRTLIDTPNKSLNKSIDAIMEYKDKSEYNRIWRIWSKKPTDEERQNDEWED